MPAHLQTPLQLHPGHPRCPLPPCILFLPLPFLTHSSPLHPQPLSCLSLSLSLSAPLFLSALLSYPPHSSCCCIFLVHSRALNPSYDQSLSFLVTLSPPALPGNGASLIPSLADAVSSTPHDPPSYSTRHLTLHLATPPSLHPPSPTHSSFLSHPLHHSTHPLLPAAPFRRRSTRITLLHSARVMLCSITHSDTRLSIPRAPPSITPPLHSLFTLLS